MQILRAREEGRGAGGQTSSMLPTYGEDAHMQPTDAPPPPLPHPEITSVLPRIPVELYGGL